MRRTFLLPVGLVLWFALAVAPLTRAATTQPEAGAASERTDFLRQGFQFEQERRWGDALSLYEDGVRQFPGDTDLKQHFDFARLHYDLGRRYHDKSFCSLVTRLTLPEALELYGEVLSKIQAHYVESPQWKELLDRGTNAMAVAMAEPLFQQTCALKADPATIDAFCRDVRRTTSPLLVDSRDGAKNVVSWAAALAKQRLGLSPTAVVMEYVCGTTNSLDLYSSYLTPDQLNDVYSQIEGNFVGLGVELKSDNGALLIVRVITGSPAIQGGLVAGDRILAVDGRLTQSYSTEQAANLLQGPEGSTAQLTVLSADGQKRQVALRRQRVEVPSVDDVRMMDRLQGVGYLKLTCFQKTTSRDLDNALWTLHRQGMRSLIIDLRGNPGGLLVTSVEAADRFLESGVIVSTKGRSPQEDFTYTAHEPGTWRVPLVVLIDQDSASAAEIFAGAIHDHHRGVVVGKRSYGKGSVQGIFPLNLTQAGVRLTTSKFYSPTGRPYAGVGVEPDLLVQQVAKPVNGTSAPANPQDDPVLATALQTARQQLAQR